MRNPWDTLQKILNHPEPPGYRRTVPRPRPKLDPFLPVIHQILEGDKKVPRKQRHTTRRIFERLRDEYGYTGGKTVVKEAVSAWRRTRAEVFVPLAHRPGFAQVDFGQAEVISSGMVAKGRHLREFEAALAEHLGVKHAIAVSSCTTGLMLAYKCLGLQGDVVIPSFTFMATASSLVWAGLRPVFGDVDAQTTNLDPAAAEAAITPETSAIVVVHNFGNPADIDAFRAIADRHGLKLIFDAAHGFGTLYRGAPVGAQGHAQVFSMSPTKLLIAGEGGLITTNDDETAEQLRFGREYGNSGNYDSAFAGFNARMPEFNALLGLKGLRGLEASARRRNEVAALYREELGCLSGLTFQEVRPGNRSSFKDFSIVVDPEAFGLTCDELAAALGAENIDTRKYYDPPVHRQTAYRRYADGRP
ncbi:MAG TPA: aminotransferase class I/II-fold pyridoxal phosphate-dependent enzyme, partial [Isosphaeraceae bacterium]|nr:aminotransferase class I/II-fold pyridoxal phosphate-dependent enzyme [Isosphaeraceae bacterium]